MVSHIPSARMVTLDGEDNLPWSGENTRAITRAIAEFIADRTDDSPVSDTVLTTILCISIDVDDPRKDRTGDDWREAAR